MRSFLAVATLLCFLSSYVSATALTYRMTPNEKSCFYAWVEEKGVKMAFYFAVRLSLYMSAAPRSLTESNTIFVPPGTIRRLLRHRLPRNRPRRPNNNRRPKRAPGRLRLYGERCGRVRLLLRQRHEFDIG